MKVAFVDNTCNNGYVMMRYLNDRGIDTDLLIIGNTTPHADPLNDTFDKKYWNKIIHLQWQHKSLLRLSKKEINSVFDNYDFVIGSDYLPAIFYKIKRKIDVFLPHGTDLFKYPFVKLNSFSKKNIGEYILGKMQKLGIKNYTKNLLMEFTNDNNEAYLQKIHSKCHRLQLSNIFVYNNQEFLETKNSGLLKQWRQEGTKIFFHHCQHIWVNPEFDLFNKANNQIIQAFAEFLKTAKSNNYKLIFFERGEDIAASKKLIAELGLEKHIHWFGYMPRVEILSCLQFVDLGIGEMGHSWYSYSVVHEFLAMGVPMVHKCNVEYFTNKGLEAYPMYAVQNQEELLKVFGNFEETPEKFIEMGKQAKYWFDASNAKFFNKFCKLIQPSTVS
jgi:glycosyltransferase involved in cell wall biosynthesis